MNQCIRKTPKLHEQTRSETLILPLRAEHKGGKKLEGKGGGSSSPYFCMLYVARKIKSMGLEPFSNILTYQCGGDSVRGTGKRKEGRNGKAD